MKDETVLDIAIIDKTVPKKNYREHKGIFMVLENNKITQESGELYDIGADYFGYDPYEQAPLPSYSLTTSPDLIYVADTYGVYNNDLEKLPDGERSQQIYGGIELLEWNKVMSTKEEHTTLIGEFNSFASPTDEMTSNVMQQNLNVDWSDWIGRYFNDLNSDEIPPWLIRNYEEQTKEKWTFNGPGIAFVHTSDQVIILDKGLADSLVRFTLTSEGEKKFPKVNPSSYMYWFDIVMPTDDSVVLANYELELSAKAEQQLKEAGLPLVFPAVIHNKEDKTYYFAGDYAEYPQRVLTKWAGVHLLFKLIAKEDTQFYWQTYTPMLNTILGEVAEERAVRKGEGTKTGA